MFKLEEKFDKYYKKLEEQSLLENNAFKRASAKLLMNTGWYDQEEAENEADNIFNKLSAFRGAGHAWLYKYLKGIIRIAIENSSNANELEKFINNNKEIFNDYLNYAVIKRAKIANDNDKTNFDNQFINDMSIENVKGVIDQYNVEKDEKSQKQLQNMEFNDSSEYELIPINAYSTFSKFGNLITGDGINSKSSWCAANDESTYKQYLDNNENMIFILVKKNWEQIPFNSISNEKYKGKDEYGNSLIAIVVNKNNAYLSYAVLRCNHIGIIGNADRQYTTYAELSEIAGFNVKDTVINYLKEIGTLRSTYTIDINDLDIQAITLLLVEEAKKIPEEIRTYYDYWWLRSPGNNLTYAANVTHDGSVYYLGNNVNIDQIAVRPALRVANLKSLNLKIGDIVIINDTWWVVVLDNYLLCNDKSFGRHRFDAKSNNYEKSEIKQYIHEKAREFGLI